MQVLLLCIRFELNEFPLDIHKPLHILEINENNVVIVVEHDMVRVDVPVEVAAVMEKLKGLDELLRYFECVHLYALESTLVLLYHEDVAGQGLVEVVDLVYADASGLDYILPESFVHPTHEVHVLALLTVLYHHWF